MHGQLPKVLICTTSILTDDGNPHELLLQDNLGVLGASRIGRPVHGREEEERVELGRAVVHHDEARLVGSNGVAGDGDAHAGNDVKQTLKWIRS